MFGPTATNAALKGMYNSLTVWQHATKHQTIGAIVAVYNAGQAVGTFATGYSADKFSRRWTICGAGILGSCNQCTDGYPSQD